MPLSRPNILWISLEDCSPRFGCHGDAVARTPNIDRLAREGTIFPNTFCTSPVSSPSRTTVITGFPATAMSAQHMRTTYEIEEFPELPTPYMAVPPPFVKCFTELLRAEGYYCSNNGKTDYQFRSPSTAWDDNGKPASLREIHWRNRPDPRQPFFSVFNLEDTHESRMWPGSEMQLEADRRPVPRTDPASVSVPPYLPDTLPVREAIARQYDNIAHNDALAGSLLADLEEDGLVDKTIVMLWSDHGEGLPRCKRFLYDSGTRVPLIVRWPGRLAPATTDDRLVSLIDLAPTVLEAAGIPVPWHLRGLSVAGTARNAGVFSHRDRMDGDYDKSRSVRTAKYKYIRNYYPGRERYGYIPYRSKHEAMQAIRSEQLRGSESLDLPCPPEELFDLESDPHEMQNLAGDPELRPVLEELRSALDTWQRENDPEVNASETEISERVWPGGKEPVTAKPVAVIYSALNLQGRIVEESVRDEGAAMLQFASATEGASIAYREASDSGSGGWKLYRRALRLQPGTHVYEARAVRYGYAESELRTVRIELAGGQVSVR